MGQYWIPVNLTKREYVMPHKLGTGLKLWEQLANQPGTGAALIVLTAAMPEARGGGDFDLESNWHGPERTFPEHNISPGPMPEDYPIIAKRTIGRWAGDRIALVGDYAEREDLPEGDNADLIYSLCEDKSEFAESVKWYRENNQAEKSERLSKLEPFTDISDDVARVIEHELGGHYEGDGWRTWKEQPTEHPVPPPKPKRRRKVTAA